MEINQFNLRIYALWIVETKVLVIKEPYAGEILYKFPGGGVEYGESIINALYREMKEELSVDVIRHQHFYTQEFFLASRFKQHEQIQTFYYKIDVKDDSQLKTTDPDIEAIYWVDINPKLIDLLTLPVDKHVANMLLTKI